MYKFVLNIICLSFYLFLAGHQVAANSISAVMLPVGLQVWKIVTADPILTIMFENSLRTLFEAEMLKTFNEH